MRDTSVHVVGLFALRPARRAAADCLPCLPSSAPPCLPAHCTVPHPTPCPAATTWCSCPSTSPSASCCPTCAPACSAPSEAGSSQGWGSVPCGWWDGACPREGTLDAKAPGSSCSAAPHRTPRPCSVSYFPTGMCCTTAWSTPTSTWPRCWRPTPRRTLTRVSGTAASCQAGGVPTACLEWKHGLAWASAAAGCGCKYLRPAPCCPRHPAPHIPTLAMPVAWTSLASSAAELLATLRLCYDSLLSTGDVHVANAHLLDVLRQVGTQHQPSSRGRRSSWHLGVSRWGPPLQTTRVWLWHFARRLLACLTRSPVPALRAPCPSGPPPPPRRVHFRPALLACSCASWTSGRRA